jgi:hypothetical protein
MSELKQAVRDQRQAFEASLVLIEGRQLLPAHG